MKIDVYIVHYDTKYGTDIGGIYLGGDGSAAEDEFAENVMDEIEGYFGWEQAHAEAEAVALGLPCDPRTWTPKQTIEFWYDVDCHGENYSRLYEDRVEITFGSILAAIWRAIT